jgi:hypothetical protein
MYTRVSLYKTITFRTMNFKSKHSSLLMELGSRDVSPSGASWGKSVKKGKLLFHPSLRRSLLRFDRVQLWYLERIRRLLHVHEHDVCRWF